MLIMTYYGSHEIGKERRKELRRQQEKVREGGGGKGKGREGKEMKLLFF